MLSQAPATLRHLVRVRRSDAAARAKGAAASAIVGDIAIQAGHALNAVLSASQAVIAPGQRVAVLRSRHVGA